jgi:hypothetical protein
MRVRFFETKPGTSPAVTWFRTALGRDERAIVGADLRTAQDNWNPGMPLVRPLGAALRGALDASYPRGACDAVRARG